MAALKRIIIPTVLLLGNAVSPIAAFAFTDALVDFSIGGVAGATGAFVSYPLDYVKCQMQSESGKAKYKNGLDCFSRTISEEGPLQLFRGVGVQVAGIAPEKSIKLGVNDIVKGAIASQTGTLPLWGELVAASLSGVGQVVVTSPLEVLKVGLQTSDKSIGELFQDIGGVQGLFRGSQACILRDVIFSATLFPIYLHLHGTCPSFVAGAAAGVVAAFVGTPPDFIKTRILAQDSVARISVQQPLQAEPFLVEYKNEGSAGILLKTDTKDSSSTNPFVVGHQIAQREGWQVMFTGVTERCIGSIPRFGVTLSLYDYLKVYAVAHGWMA